MFLVPFWAVICIAIAAGLILLCCLICICRYCCCRRKKAKDAKKGLKGVVDLKSVQMLGHAYKEKVCLMRFFSGTVTNHTAIMCRWEKFSMRKREQYMVCSKIVQRNWLGDYASLMAFH